MAKAPGLQDQCGRSVGRGNSNLGTPISWVKAHRSQSRFEVAQVPTSLLSAATPAQQYPCAQYLSTQIWASMPAPSSLLPHPYTRIYLEREWGRLPGLSWVQRTCGLLPGKRRENRGEIQSMCAKSRNFPDFPGCGGKLGQGKKV